MPYIDAAILGVVEGITEFLPISSTGHLVLTSTLFGLVQTDAVKSFEIAIQLGAILAVVVFYWRKFFNIKLLTKLAVAFLPTGIVGLFFYKLVKSYLLGNEWVVVASLFFGGIALIVFEWFEGKREKTEGTVERITYKQAFGIGCAQSLSMIPGLSRSATSIVGGLALRAPRMAVVEFSFLLAVPTMLVATGYDLLKSHTSFSGTDVTALAIGFVVSFIVALGAIKWLLAFVRNHTFVPFGVYRILVAVLFYFAVLR